MRPAISRAEVFAIARSLGADPVETNHIEVTGKAVTVVTYKLNESGGRYLDESTGEAAIETTVIPIVGFDGNAETVRMRHPKLPGQEIDVRPRGVSQRAMAGWEVVDSPFAKGGFIPSGVTEVKNTTGEPIPVVPIPPPDSGTQTEAPAEPGASASPAPRRRKASTKKQEEV